MNVSEWLVMADQSLGTDACWPTRGGIGSDGYATRWFTGIGNLRLARVALEHRLGRPIAPRMHALHTCDNRACINPLHIYEGTPKDNGRDRSARRRFRQNGDPLMVLAWTNDGRSVLSNGVKGEAA
jgi:hypothetical protein